MWCEVANPPFNGAEFDTLEAAQAWCPANCGPWTQSYFSGFVVCTSMVAGLNCQDHIYYCTNVRTIGDANERLRAMAESHCAANHPGKIVVSRDIRLEGGYGFSDYCYTAHLNMYSYAYQ